MEGSVKASGVDVGPGVGVGNGEAGRRGAVGNENVGRGMDVPGVVALRSTVARATAVDVPVGTALCVAAKAVLTVDMAVSIRSAWLSAGVDRELLQEASMIAARNKGRHVLPIMFILPLPLLLHKETPHGSRLFQGCALTA